MITFETQEDFENAVMQVIRDRLEVVVTVNNQTMGFYDGSAKKVRVSLIDNTIGDQITTCEDYA